MCKAEGVFADSEYDVGDTKDKAMAVTSDGGDVAHRNVWGGVYDVDKR